MATVVRASRRWSRWRVVAIVAVLGIVMAVDSIVNAGTTSSIYLGVGDCFVAPDADSTFNRVTDQSCQGPHETQIYAEVEANSIFGADYKCADALEAILPAAYSALPDDADVTIFGDEDRDDYFCALTSASGQLVGSLTE